MPLRHHALGQFAHHNLDAAIMGRYALLSDHGNFHVLPSHPLQPPLLREISHYEGEGNPISSPDAFCCTFRCHLMHSSYHTHGLIETKLHRFSEIFSVFRVFRKFLGKTAAIFHKMPCLFASVFSRKRYTCGSKKQRYFMCKKTV